jgi:hypothetical protein
VAPDSSARNLFIMVDALSQAMLVAMPSTGKHNANARPRLLNILDG